MKVLAIVFAGVFLASAIVGCGEDAAPKAAQEDQAVAPEAQTTTVDSALSSCDLIRANAKVNCISTYNSAVSNCSSKYVLCVLSGGSNCQTMRVLCNASAQNALTTCIQSADISWLLCNLR